LGKIKKQKKVKLVFGLITAKEDLFLKIERILSKKFGHLDFRSNIINFNHTSYYQKEFGCNLKRQFLSIAQLIKPETLPSIKLFTNSIENKLSQNGCRQINIDPGYITEAKLILASTKDFTHRIYLGRGVFEEVTLYYQNNNFNSWQWTFPDYKTKAYINIFKRIRELYLKQLKDEAS